MDVVKLFKARSVFVWALADQLVSSAGNVLLLSQLARGLGAKQFGVVAVFYGIVLILVAFFRALLSEVINSSHHEDQQRDRADRAARVLTLLIAGFILTSSVAFISIAGASVPALLFVALSVIVVQDRIRWEWIYRRQTQRSFAIDATWTIAQIVYLVVFANSILSPPPRTAVVAWIFGAVLSMVWVRRIGSSTTIGRALRWAKEHRHASLTAGTQSLVVNGFGYVPAFIFLALGQPKWSAGYVVANSVLGLQTAMVASFRPILFSRFSMSRGQESWKAIGRICGGMALLSLLISAGAIVVLAIVGKSIYGDAASIALTMTAWIGIRQAFGSASTVLLGVLRARGAWSKGLLGEILTAIELLALMLTAGALMGVSWVTPAQALGAAVSLCIWIALLHSTRTRFTGGPSAISDN